MPALVKSRFGASGSSDEDGTMVCFFSRKKSRNDCRISAEVIIFSPRMHTNKHQFDKAENPPRLKWNSLRAALAGQFPTDAFAQRPRLRESCLRIIGRTGG